MLKITVTDNTGNEIDHSKGLFCAQTKKQYWILLGLISDDKNLVCGGANLESEVESQAKQLFNFIYSQVPCSVADRLTNKLIEFQKTRKIS